MIRFDVQDMTCGHCAATITRAVKTLDPRAVVQIDLATHRVAIDSVETDAAELASGIREAGYTPVLLPKD